MAITLDYFEVANWFTAAAQSVAVDYVAGDILVVASGSGAASLGLIPDPTAANVTFDPVGGSPDNTGGTDEVGYGMWYGEAAGSGSSVTIKGATSAQGGGAVWRVRGATLTGAIELGPNSTEAVFNQAVSAGDLGIYAAFDWNAHTGDLTAAGGLTERADFGNGTNYGGWLGDRVYDSAGTFDLGVTDYSALKVKHAALILLPAATGTIEQEGFRWHADGTESGSTPTQAQDVDDTAAVGDARILRIILNATGDPAAMTAELRAQKNGAGGYVPVPVGATITPTISYGAAGSDTDSTGDPNPTYPAGITTDSELVLVTSSKPSTANGGSLTNPSGWTRRGEMSGATDGNTGGYGATVGTDTGNMNLYVLTKDTVAGTETGNIGAVNHAGQNNATAGVFRLEKSESGTVSWAVATGKDTSAGAFSAAIDAIDLAPGDLLMWAFAIPTDVTTPGQFSAHSITAPGITFSAITEIREWDATAGQDQGGLICTATVTAGSGSVAPTVSATTGGTTTNVRGPVVLLRARPDTVTNELFIAPSASITDGEATTDRETAPAGKTGAPVDPLVTVLHAHSDGNTPGQTKSATGLAFETGDRVLVVGYAMSAGNGDTFSPGVTDTASANSPTWSALVNSATNVTSSSAFCTKLVSFLSDPLTADETFDLTLDWQTGSANTYYGSLTVARISGLAAGAAVRTAQDVGSFSDDDASCALGGAVAFGNLAMMIVAGRGTGTVTYDAVPTDFAQVPGSTVGPTDKFHLSAIASVTTTASSVAWGFEATSDPENLCSIAFELDSDAGPSDWTPGKIWDASNGIGTIDPGADQWTTVGWVLDTQAPAVDTDFWDFQVYVGGAAVDTVTEVPRLTLGAGGGTAHDRTSNDGSTATDADGRTADAARSRTEVATASDAGSRSSAQARSAVDGATASDAASRAVAKAASVAETATAGDSGSKVAASTRSAGEAATAADAASRLGASGRAPADSAVAADVGARSAAQARSAADGSTASDTASHEIFAGEQHARSEADSSTATDTSGRSAASARSSTEAPTATDAGARSSAQARARADGSTATDTATRAGGSLRSAAESATASDAANHSLTIGATEHSRSASESATATDATARVASSARAQADGSTATDSVTKTLGLLLAFSEVALGSDGATRALSALRGPSEGSVATDTAQRLLEALRGLLEAATASDSFTVVLAGAARADVADCVVRASWDTIGLLAPDTIELVRPDSIELKRKCC